MEQPRWSAAPACSSTPRIHAPSPTASPRCSRVRRRSPSVEPRPRDTTSTGRRDDAVTIAHAFKSSATTVGLAKLSTLAEELEIARTYERIEIEPVLPGCTVYPAKQSVPGGSVLSEVRFSVVAQVKGEVPGTVYLRNGERQRLVRLKITVAEPRRAAWTAAAGLVLPYATTVMKHEHLDFESQLGAGSRPCQPTRSAPVRLRVPEASTLEITNSRSAPIIVRPK